MVLYRHDRDFSIEINGQELMHSRQHASELALARLGCAHLAGREAARVLVGGLGMGYTLRQALDMLGPDASVVVGELLDAVVEWNRAFFGELNGRPLEDERVDLKTGDVVELIRHAPGRFDAILLDIDNGPHAMTDPGNSRLYGPEGIRACRRALRARGCLAVWSAAPCKDFEHRLMASSLHVRRFRVPAYKGSKSPSRFVWVASEDERMLPPGGGEPRPPRAKQPHPGPRRTRSRR
jgi:spermidine synthase